MSERRAVVRKTRDGKRWVVFIEHASRSTVRLYFDSWDIALTEAIRAVNQ